MCASNDAAGVKYVSYRIRTCYIMLRPIMARHVNGCRGDV